jgi:hypothetical protein
MLPPGEYGGGYGATHYPDVAGKPSVSLGGGGTSCEQLLALADAYQTKKGLPFLNWLDANTWTWMNVDEKLDKFALWNTNDYDVFIGKKEGQKSQVAFDILVAAASAPTAAASAPTAAASAPTAAAPTTTAAAPTTTTAAAPTTTAAATPSTAQPRPTSAFTDCRGGVEALTENNVVRVRPERVLRVL